MPKHSIKFFATIISGVHPLIYLGLYIFLIPLFAAAFYLAPPGLYAPYAHLEASAGRDALHLGGVLGAAVRRSVALKKDHQIVVSGLKVRAKSIELGALSSRDGKKLSFVLYATFEGGGSPAEKQLGIALPISLNIDEFIRVGDAINNKNLDWADRTIFPVKVHLGNRATVFRAFDEAAFKELLLPYSEPSILAPALVLRRKV